MKHLYIIFIISLLPILAYGQSAYFSTDSTSSYGIKIVDGGDMINSQLCQVKKGDKILQYTPYEVKEFGLKGGRVYVSKQIQIGDSLKRVFMERLCDGKAALYYFRSKHNKRFFIEKDSTLFVEILKEKSLSEQLLDLTEDCSKVTNTSKVVSYNKNSLVKFTSLYNNCELKPNPFLKYGMFFGMNQSKPVLNSRISDDVLLKSNFKNDNSFYYGFFIDVPMSLSNFSVFTSLGLYKSSFACTIASDPYICDILISQMSFKLPILIKYTFPSFNYRPYFNFGINYSNNLRNKSTIYKATINKDIIQYSTPDKENLISNHQIGYLCGLGIQYYHNYNRYIFLEIRYNKDYSMKSEEVYNKNNIEIVCGINL